VQIRLVGSVPASSCSPWASCRCSPSSSATSSPTPPAPGSRRERSVPERVEVRATE